MSTEIILQRIKSRLEVIKRTTQPYKENEFISGYAQGTIDCCDSLLLFIKELEDEIEKNIEKNIE